MRGWRLPVTSDEIKKRFERLPGVQSVVRVSVNPKKFAHVDLIISDEEEAILTKLRNIYKNARWKGGLLEFEKGKPDFLERLELEKEKATCDNSASHVPSPLNFEDIELRIRKRPGCSLILN